MTSLLEQPEVVSSTAISDDDFVEAWARTGAKSFKPFYGTLQGPRFSKKLWGSNYRVSYYDETTNTLVSSYFIILRQKPKREVIVAKQ